MKYIHVYALFLMPFFHSSCGQNQPNVPKDSIKSATKDTASSYGPNSMIRNVKQDRNGNILIASGNLSLATRDSGVYNYNGKSLPTGQASIKKGAFCGILEANDGSIWFGSLVSGSGMCRYDGKTITGFKSKEGQK
jgi:hypothetical protein